MMSEPLQSFLLEYFQRQRPLPGATLADQLGCAYLDAGVINSLGLIDLVTEIESRFNVRFENEDFEDPRFRTVGGLLAILRSKVNGTE